MNSKNKNLKYFHYEKINIQNNIRDSYFSFSAE